MSSFLGLILLAFTIFNMNAAGEIEDDVKGFITLSKFTQILEESAGKKLSPEEIKRLKIVSEMMIDKNGDGLLQFQEMGPFKAGIFPHRTAFRLIDTFRLVDKNENGFLDIKEIESFPGWKRWKWLSKMTGDSLKNVLRHGLGVDLLGVDGQMDFEEYLRWLTITNPNTFFYRE